MPTIIAEPTAWSQQAWSIGNRSQPVQVRGCQCPTLAESQAPPHFSFPPTFTDPFAGWSYCAGVVLGVLRAHGKGAESEFVAAEANLDIAHTSVALQALSDGQFAYVNTVKVPWYYSTRPAYLWRETPHPELLGTSFVRYHPYSDMPERLPPQFWWMFWSGLDPMLIRLPEHASYVASRMIRSDMQRRNLVAETWALEHLPVDVLEHLVDMAEYGGSTIGVRIKKTIAHRRNQQW